ncbi:MAG: heavy-metal-associated domain-containing protein [Nannocystaceae bacterium]
MSTSRPGSPTKHRSWAIRGRLVGLAGALVWAGLASNLSCGPAPLVEADLTTTTIRVEGMVCDSCEGAIKAEVEKLDGVASCVADHEAKSAIVRHDPARASVDAIAAAIEKLGYTVVRG